MVKMWIFVHLPQLGIYIKSIKTNDKVSFEKKVLCIGGEQNTRKFFSSNDLIELRKIAS